MAKKLWRQEWILEEVPKSYFVVAEDVKTADDSFDSYEIQKALCSETIAHPVEDPKPVIELTDEEAKLLEGAYYSKMELKREFHLPGPLRKKLEGIL